MIDRDKVIKGLSHCTRPSEVGKGGNFCMDCPYTEPIGFNQFKCNGQQMKKDAIALIKEQETEISFLKGMQLKTIHNMSEEDIGNAVAELLQLKGR